MFLWCTRKHLNLYRLCRMQDSWGIFSASCINRLACCDVRLESRWVYCGQITLMKSIAVDRNDSCVFSISLLLADSSKYWVISRDVFRCELLRKVRCRVIAIPLHWVNFDMKQCRLIGFVPIGQQLVMLRFVLIIDYLNTLSRYRKWLYIRLI